MAKVLVATLAAALFAGASAIYPGDHWQFATKLNNGIANGTSPLRAQRRDRVFSSRPVPILP
jgi:hypothetical protein